MEVCFDDAGGIEIAFQYLKRLQPFIHPSVTPSIRSSIS